MPVAKRAPEVPSASRYYEDNAQAYIGQTTDVDMSDLYAEFLPHIAPGGRILDAGSGSGRDTLSFRQRGYAVEAFDASPALAAASTRLTGVPTKVTRFQEFRSVPRFDGVWACASLLHVPKRELPDAIARLADALKPRGVLYASFKYGSGERRTQDGRLFVDLSEAELRSLLASVPSLTVTKIWITEGEGVLRGKSRWLNVIAVKAEREAFNA
jgi:SAM-dependent methyltransferase